MRWGSNPLSDRLLGGAAFEVAHDAGGVGRAEKLAALVAWPEAFANLRVCWRAQQRDRNCGRCAKCVLTLLSLELQGLPRPASLPEPLDAERLLRLAPLDAVHLDAAASLLASARRSRAEHPLLPALARCVAWNARRQALSRPAGPWRAALRRLRLRRLERRGP